MSSNILQNPWTRSKEGWIAGVCQGLAERFDMNPGAVRLLWIASVIFLGVGVLLYFLCAFIMPVEGEEEKALRPKILGVCLRLSERMEIDVVPLRILAVIALLGSFGTVFFIYILLHFLLPTDESYQN